MTKRKPVLVLVGVLLVAAWALAFVPRVFAPLAQFTVPALVTLLLAVVALSCSFATAMSDRGRMATVATVLLLLVAHLGIWQESRGADDIEKSWRSRGARDIVGSLSDVSNAVVTLERQSGTIASAVADHVHRFGLSYDLRDRVKLFAAIDSLVATVAAQDPITIDAQVGVQLFDADGLRVSWSGWPQSIGSLERRLLSTATPVTYTRSVSLYQILTHIEPVTIDGVAVATVVVDLPLEVNFRVNNRYLKSTNLAAKIASDRNVNVQFDYFRAQAALLSQLPRMRADLDALNEKRAALQARRPARVDADSLLLYHPFPADVEPIAGISGDRDRGLSGRVLVRSRHGNPLVSITARSTPFRYFESRARGGAQTVTIWSLVGAMLVLLGLMAWRLPIATRGARTAVRGVIYVSALVLLRAALLALPTTNTTGGLRWFDPTVFATPAFGGAMRSPGDLLITAVFALLAAYGLIKMFRQRREIGTAEDTRPKVLRNVTAAMVAAAVFAVAAAVVDRFLSALVANSNPRLLGETMTVTDPMVITLQLSAFAMIAAILLGAMLLVWMVLRWQGWHGPRGLMLLGVAFAAVLAATTGRWETLPLVALSLALALFGPRYAQREDLASIVLAGFALVLVVSTHTYTYLHQHYNVLRQNFTIEKANSLTDPVDDWRVVILEDLLSDVGDNPNVRRALRQPDSEFARRLAFDTWAEGALSLLGYGCAIHVIDADGRDVSSFEVDMPFRVNLQSPGERLDIPQNDEWIVLDLTRLTPQGMVRFYRGILNVSENLALGTDLPSREVIGTVVVDIPFFVEDLKWAARTGPRTPELLRNIQEGGVAPRVEEPDALLLARVYDGQVYESSSDVLPVGWELSDDVLSRAADETWPLLSLDGTSFRIVTRLNADADGYLLAGFAVPSAGRHLLRWSVLLSMYLAFLFVVLVVVLALSRVPHLRVLLPTLTPGRRLGFQQKLLVSFLLIALVPAVILGWFSTRFIKDRFIVENEQEALYKAYTARKAFVNLLASEATLFMDRVDIESIYRDAARHTYTGPGRMVVFLDQQGTELVPDDTVTPIDVGELGSLSREALFVLWEEGRPYIGTLTGPLYAADTTGVSSVYMWYGREAGAELLGDIAAQAGGDVNIYDDGELAASSRSGLLAGGFISSVMTQDPFVKVSLLASDELLATERAGDYRYQVAYLPLISWGNGGRDPYFSAVKQLDTQTAGAALSVPLLFRPESYSMEVQRATSILLGIFALLLVATMGLGLLLARGIFEPLRGLLEGTRRISRGDFSVRLDESRGDEIGTVMAAFNEMTDRVSTSQRQLEERRRYVETILANIGTGVLSTDAAGVVQTVNRSARRILGANHGDVLGKSVDELIAANVAPELFGVMANLDGKDFTSGEIDISGYGDGATIKYVTTKLTAGEQQVGTVVVFEDVTELIQSKKLSAWVEMARQIAHEIKNPLTPIRISTQFMQRAHEQGSEHFDRIFREGSEEIIKQVDVLKRIASEFSSYGRMQKLDIKPIPLHHLLVDIVTPYQRNDAGVDIEYQGDCEHVTVLADTEAVRKICANLIENALEAMQGGGQLRVGCGTQGQDNGLFLRVTFSDTGPGLDAEVIGKLFEPYFSTKTTGTGLGLAICRTLAREMGGDVDVVNRNDGNGVEASLSLKVSS